jgi:hypothetical protein
MSFRRSHADRSLRSLAASAALRAGVAVASLLAPANAGADPVVTNNWNQWDDDARDGLMQGTTKLALGVDYTTYTATPSEGHTVRLGLELEHLLRDHWGVVGSIALPVAGQWVAPASIGIRFHFVPKFPLDPYVSLAGGVAWLAPDSLPAIAAPIATARAGVALYYFGLFFAQVEGGYDVARYGREGVDVDLSGATFAGRLGVYF